MIEEILNQVLQTLHLVVGDLLSCFKFSDRVKLSQAILGVLHLVLIMLELELAEDVDHSRVIDDVIELFEQGVEGVGDLLGRRNKFAQLDLLCLIEAHVLEVLVQINLECELLLVLAHVVADAELDVIVDLLFCLGFGGLFDLFMIGLIINRSLGRLLLDDSLG